MKAADEISQDELRERGLQALERELGLVGMIRFLQLVEPGKGDYTEERRPWLDKLTLEEIKAKLDERRKT